MRRPFDGTVEGPLASSDVGAELITLGCSPV
jgi:hypothetical protein